MFLSLDNFSKMKNEQMYSYSLNRIVLVRVIQKTELIGKKETYFKMLAHTVIEAEKSHSLLFAVRTPRKITNTAGELMV